MEFAYFEVVRWALCFFFIFPAAACNGSETEPVLDGKTAADWRTELDDAGQRKSAVRRLIDAGSEATPLLIALLDVPRGDAPIIAAQLLGDHGKAGVDALARTLESRSDALRVTAAASLGVIGSDAQSAVPALRKMRSPPNGLDLRIAACVGIWGITHEVSEIMPTMLDGLKANKPELVFATTGLAALVGAPAVRPLMVALESDDPKLRVAAVDALGAIGGAAAPARPKIQALLEDRVHAVRAAARRALRSVR